MLDFPATVDDGGPMSDNLYDARTFWDLLSRRTPRHHRTRRCCSTRPTGRVTFGEFPARAERVAAGLYAHGRA